MDYKLVKFDINDCFNQNLFPSFTILRARCSDCLEYNMI